MSRGKQMGLTAHFLPAGIVVAVFRCTGAQDYGLGWASGGLSWLGTPVPCALTAVCIRCSSRLAF